ncbi:MAG TPA: hypothetical protein DCX53_15040 [Anaerolineae bacterium]|nr:hypothetical protein [Anaerolineae bacterium]
MFPIKKLRLFLFIILSYITACSSASDPTAVPATAIPTILPTATATRVPPTPSSSNDPILWDDLQVTMDQVEITQEYVTEFGPTRNPPEGKKFLWVRIRLQNTGQVEMNVPDFTHFSVLYAATEIKPIYGHRNGYTDYTTLGSPIFPEQEVDGWLRFDIPAAAELRELLFVFLPESVQVGSSFSSPNYPYAEDKPTYVWDLE